MFFADGTGYVKDPFDHLESIANHKKDVSPDEDHPKPDNTTFCLVVFNPRQNYTFLVERIMLRKVVVLVD